MNVALDGCCLGIEYTVAKVSTTGDWRLFALKDSALRALGVSGTGAEVRLFLLRSRNSSEGSPITSLDSAQAHELARKVCIGPCHRSRGMFQEYVLFTVLHTPFSFVLAAMLLFALVYEATTQVVLLLFPGPPLVPQAAVHSSMDNLAAHSCWSCVCFSSTFIDRYLA